MRLSDIMSGAGLAGYAEVALILFLLAFAAIATWIFLPSRKQDFDRAGRLPLEDEPPAPAKPKEHQA
jgi:cbb3-type cytochrome oxidase subunit 3